MTARAFVIAVEDYSAGNYLPNLPGTNEDAGRFIKWFVGNKVEAGDKPPGVPPEEVKPEQVTPGLIFCCAGAEISWRTAGTTRLEIINELKRFVAGCADVTTEFYFYFSGHGFAYKELPAGRPADVLVGSDFADLESGGNACLRLDEIQTKLWSALGSKHHYYFIDACRNAISRSEIEVPSLGLTFKPSSLGNPTVYVLFSTAQGAPAKTKSGFAQALVMGLEGRGKAKGWNGKRMFVMFDRLGKYVKEQLRKLSGQEVKFYKNGDDPDGQIIELTPTPVSVCEVQIEEAGEDDLFRLLVRDARGYLSREDATIKGASGAVNLPPDEYFIELAHAERPVVQVNPPQSEEPLDLYDSLALVFRLEPPELPIIVTRGSRRGGLGSGLESFRGLDAGTTFKAPQPAELVLEGASPRGEFLLTNADTGEARVVQAGRVGSLSPGSYTVKLRELGVTVASREVSLKPGEELRVNLLDRDASPVHRSILRAVTGDEAASLADFSEQLGPIADWNLSLWLALLGASRIVAPPSSFRKLGPLPLADFEDVRPGDAPIYVLAACEGGSKDVQIGLGEDETASWKTLREVTDMKGVYDLRMQSRPGPHLLSFVIGGRTPVTYSTYNLPNRVTLFTLVENEEGRVVAHQYLLPLYKLQPHLEPFVRQRLGYLNNQPLRSVRMMELAQSQFARRRSVQGLLTKADVQTWDMLFHQKWLDPVMSLIAAYDLLRRGRAVEMHGWLEEVIGNLRKYFHGLPDTEALAKLIGMNWRMPDAAPLMLDGVLAFSEGQEQHFLHLSPDKLDYESPWTSWHGAVVPPATRS